MAICQIKIVAHTTFGQDKVIAQFLAQMMNMDFNSITINVLLPAVEFTF